MYSLGEHFNILQDKSVNQECIFKGTNFRFTILSKGLIRIEYNQNGNFNDDLTKIVINRNFKKPEFSVKEDKNFLEITTDNFVLNYQKEQDITKSKFLKIKIGNTDNYWMYNHIEAKNYPTFTDLKNKTKSLYSLDGFVTIDDSKTELLEENGMYHKRETNGIDIYLFVYNKDFHSCLYDYYTLTGFPPLVPRFTFGNWWSKNETYNDIELKQLIDNFEANKIPLSVILLDKDWHVRKIDKKNPLKTGFTFNKELFHSPIDMINYMHQKNLRVGLSVNPTEGFHDIDEYYEKAKEHLEVDENNVIPYNVLNPKWVDVYLKLFIHPLDALGIDFYFIDVEDNSDKTFLLKNYHFQDMNRNYKRRPMIMGYYSDTLQHKYPVTYVGKSVVSWDSLKEIPFINMNATNLGNCYYTHDIGGYYKGSEDNELYIRYVQLGVFSPILKFGSDRSKYYKREPWRWSIKTFTIARDYLTLRHKLIPYLYNEAFNYHKHGKPLVTPLFYTNPEMYDDPIYKNEYYFGSQLFITPIIKKKDHVMDRVVHRFYLPHGLWYDFFTGKKFLGNNTYTSFFKDQNYPVFAQAGSIIPLAIDTETNPVNPPKNLEIQFFPGKNNEITFYEDDGVSSLYKKGFFLKTKIDYNYLPNNYTVILKALDGKRGIIPDKRNYKLVFRNVKKASDVIIYEGKHKIEGISYVEGNNFVVEVKEVSTIEQLTVNCKGKDIEIDATRVINEDIKEILGDLQIETLMKEKIDAIIFSDLPIKKKRIEIRKLQRQKLEGKFVKLFLNLLEYIGQI